MSSLPSLTSRAGPGARRARAWHTVAPKADRRSSSSSSSSSWHVRCSAASQAQHPSAAPESAGGQREEAWAAAALRDASRRGWGELRDVLVALPHLAEQHHDGALPVACASVLRLLSAQRRRPPASHAASSRPGQDAVVLSHGRRALSLLPPCSRYPHLATQLMRACAGGVAALTDRPTGDVPANCEGDVLSDVALQASPGPPEEDASGGNSSSSSTAHWQEASSGPWPGRPAGGGMAAARHAMSLLAAAASPPRGGHSPSSQAAALAALTLAEAVCVLRGLRAAGPPPAWVPADGPSQEGAAQQWEPSGSHAASSVLATIHQLVHQTLEAVEQPLLRHQPEPPPAALPPAAAGASLAACGLALAACAASPLALGAGDAALWARLRAATLQAASAGALSPPDLVAVLWAHAWSASHALPQAHGGFDGLPVRAHSEELSRCARPSQAR